MSTRASVASGLNVVPLPLALIVAALIAAPAAGVDPRLSSQWFAAGFGRALGDFALLLIPSFVLAAALARSGIAGTRGIAALLAPFAAAGTVCPDTGYAALAPAAGGRRLSVAFGAFAGFKLLVPAGPLLVAGGLGAADHRLLPIGLALLVPVWAVGELWALAVGPRAGAGDRTAGGGGVRPWLPLILAAMMMTAGGIGLSDAPVAIVLLSPRGALWIAATWAVFALPAPAGREALASGSRRAADLLMTIGAAGGFGAVLIHLVPLAEWAAARPDATAVTLYVLAAAFKLVQGSSTATFAAVTPVAAPLVAAAGVDPTTQVFAICLGSMIAILPNDSFYWLARRDLPESWSETRALAVLAGGSIAQSLTGFGALLLISALS